MQAIPNGLTTRSSAPLWVWTANGPESHENMPMRAMESTSQPDGRNQRDHSGHGHGHGHGHDHDHVCDHDVLGCIEGPGC